MKAVCCALFCFLFFLSAGWTEPLINPELPNQRVRDMGQFLSTPARALLGDFLDALAQNQKMEFYVVILKNEPIDMASRLCDQYQAEWIPKGQGGVFVYSGPDRKYAFTPTPDTLNSVGPEKIRELFTTAVENPPLRQSLDVVIATPVQRMVTAMNQAQLVDSSQRAESAELQSTRWQIIAGIAVAFALLGWIVCFTRFIKLNNFGSFQANIPPPGMAYRNPPRRSRSGRSGRRSRDGESDDESGGGEKGKRRDRF